MDVGVIGDYQRDGFAIIPHPIFHTGLIDRACSGLDAALAASAEQKRDYLDVVTGERIDLGLTTVSHGPDVTLEADGVPELLAQPCVRRNSPLLVVRRLAFNISRVSAACAPGSCAQGTS